MTSFNMGAFFWDYSGYSYSGLGITEYKEFQFSKERLFIRKTESSWLRCPENYYVFQPEARRRRRGRPRWISRQSFPKRTRILRIPSKPYFVHSVHSAIVSRMKRMIFRSFRKRNSSQKNTNTVYSEYSYPGIVPKEHAQSFTHACITLPIPVFAITGVFLRQVKSRFLPASGIHG